MYQSAVLAIDMQSAPPFVLKYFRDGHVISLDDEFVEVLDRSLGVRKRVATRDSIHGYNVSEVRESLFRGPVVGVSRGIDLRDRVANAGMIELLDYLARQSNCEIQEIADTEINRLPNVSDTQRLSYPPLTQFVEGCERGLLRISQHCHRREIIADLCAAYPDERILVLGRVEQLKELQERLPELLAKRMSTSAPQVEFVSDRERLQANDDEEFPKLILSTPVAAAGVDSEKCSIVILLDAVPCTHSLMQGVLAQVDARFRLFGFLDASRRLKPYEHARLRYVFGFNEIELKGEGLVRRPVSYGVIRQGGQTHANSVSMRPKVPGSGQFSTVNSLNAYTFHHARNATICRLARKLCTGETLTNKKYRDVRRWLRSFDFCQLSLTIAVDRLDHAIELGKRLADWPIVASKDNHLEDVSRAIRRRIKTDRQRWLLGDRQIVVSDAATMVANSPADVVIWAGGGTSSSSIPIPSEFSKVAPERPLLVVDFLDDYSQATKNWSLKRFRHFESRDIFRVGKTATAGRIARFLRQEGIRQ